MHGRQVQSTWSHWSTNPSDVDCSRFVTTASTAIILHTPLSPRHSPLAEPSQPVIHLLAIASRLSHYRHRRPTVLVTADMTVLAYGDRINSHCTQIADIYSWMRYTACIVVRTCAVLLELWLFHLAELHSKAWYGSMCNKIQQNIYFIAAFTPC